MCDGKRILKIESGMCNVEIKGTEIRPLLREFQPWKGKNR